jgi:hypothetical protein
MFSCTRFVPAQQRPRPALDGGGGDASTQARSLRHGEHLHPGLTQRGMWVMRSPAGAVCTPRERTPPAYSPPAPVRRTCVYQGVATLNQLAPTEATRRRWFPPPAEAGEGGGGSVHPGSASLQLTHHLRPAEYHHPEPASTSGSHPVPVVPAPSGGG